MRNALRPPISFEPEHKRLGITPIMRETQVIDDVFAGVDGEVYDLDGVKFATNGQMIDNNEYVWTPEAATPANHQTAPKTPQAAKQPTATPSAPQIGNYILMVSGKIILSGNLSLVESKVKDILYGDDVEFAAQNITADDIVVLKRVNIKVGVFIGE